MKTLKEIFDAGGHDVGTGDKGTVHSYIPYLCDPLFGPYRFKTLPTLLEIGVGHGYSVQTWREYFGTSEVVGVDINLGQIPAKVKENLQGIELFEGSATDEAWLQKTLGDRTFDIIIDDGSHNPSDQIQSFNILFEKYLRKGGVYVIEDVHDSDQLFQFFKGIKKPYFFYDGRSFKNRSDDCAFFVYKYE